MSKLQLSTPPDTAMRLALACADHPAASDAVPSAQFTSTMSALASSVSVVTASDGGERQGRTVTSMLSLSAEPPAILVSITRDSALAAMIEQAQAFSVSILAADQQTVADAFAGFGAVERFAAGSWDAWTSGQPRLDGAVATLDCRLSGAIEMDTHVLYAGIVLHTRTHPDRAPLLWHRRNYAVLESEGS